MELYRRIASLVDTMKRLPSDNEWHGKHADTLLALVREHMPSGAGFDNGTAIDVGRSSPERIVFDTSFHHMDDHGGYDGWTSHKVVVTPSLASGANVRVTGKDRNNIKEYIHDCFRSALETEV